jgi:hypothetical protein
LLFSLSTGSPGVSYKKTCRQSVCLQVSDDFLYQLLSGSKIGCAAGALCSFDVDLALAVRADLGGGSCGLFGLLAH